MKHFRILPFAIAASTALSISSASLAEPPAHAKGGKGKGKVEHVQKQKRSPVAIFSTDCPPGLAKKSPACVPPGQAKKWGVGDVIDWDDVHIVTQPGYYGLSRPPSGDRYAIIDGKLVRVNRESGQILSILRIVDAILD